jgi:hypothetical protein
MRHGNFVQALAIALLFVLVSFQYNEAMHDTQDEIYYLRAQKSRVSRSEYTSRFGTQHKQELELEKAYQKPEQHRTIMMYQMMGIMALALFSVFHFIRYFYTDYDVEIEPLPLARYDCATWFYNFLYFSIITIWIVLYSSEPTGAVIAYISAMLCCVKCLWHVSYVVKLKHMLKLNTWRVAEITMASIVYFHVVGFALMYYAIMLMGLPAFIQIIRETV